MQSDHAPHLPMNHVFVDFENVRQVDVAVLERKNFILHLFLGPQNKKLDVEVVEKLLIHSQSVNLVRSQKAGNNALDFVLAYHLGQAVQTDPKAWFHLISRDVGFDALVELLKSRNVKVKRHPDWASLETHANPATHTPPALSDGAAKLLTNLHKSPKNRPKKKTTLVSHAKSSLGKSATDAEGEKVVEELRKAGHLKIDAKGAVSYQ